jgi:hypothetical protein
MVLASMLKLQAVLVGGEKVYSRVLVQQYDHGLSTPALLGRNAKT